MCRATNLLLDLQIADTTNLSHIHCGTDRDILYFKDEARAKKTGLPITVRLLDMNGANFTAPEDIPICLKLIYSDSGDVIEKQIAGSKSRKSGTKGETIYGDILQVTKNGPIAMPQGKSDVEVKVHLTEASRHHFCIGGEIRPFDITCSVDEDVLIAVCNPLNRRIIVKTKLPRLTISGSVMPRPKSNRSGHGRGCRAVGGTVTSDADAVCTDLSTANPSETPDVILLPNNYIVFSITSKCKGFRVSMFVCRGVTVRCIQEKVAESIGTGISGNSVKLRYNDAWLDSKELLSNIAFLDSSAELDALIPVSFSIYCLDARVVTMTASYDTTIGWIIGEHAIVEGLNEGDRLLLRLEHNEKIVPFESTIGSLLTEGNVVINFSATMAHPSPLSSPPSLLEEETLNSPDSRDTMSVAKDMTVRIKDVSALHVLLSFCSVR